ncbi:flagellar hook assembly protein FlgD [Aestuariibacter sp. AA17]|uniref:Basal-body rod modification protein FlgD n=1 Tax=Fluctibacter corallii TaxID=2984329 RepID=A0ABT3A9Y4_9ALTE|nr:flagellar hook assembly protein FlgD [Aestuariibacter sp. AA17]MCV2885486.1 flagellar hook assembly protein FlgD [Aestuariibacter sp. AA17]
MTTVDNNSVTNKDLYWQEEGVKIDDGSRQKLSQEDFFAMLTEQLANQDPTKPVDNDQMVAQMTNFTMAEGINDLNEKFEAFSASMTSNQALQASSLIGRQVLLPGNVAPLQEGSAGISGVIINEKTTQEMEISIENAAGEVVRTMKLGTQPAGNIEFGWNGKDAEGNQLPAGNYVIKAQGSVNGEQTAIPTAINRQVASVSLAGSNQGIILNLNGDQSVKLDDVIQIGG